MFHAPLHHWKRRGRASERAGGSVGLFAASGVVVDEEVKPARRLGTDLDRVARDADHEVGVDVCTREAACSLERYDGGRVQLSAKSVLAA